MAFVGCCSGCLLFATDAFAKDPDSTLTLGGSYRSGHTESGVRFKPFVHGELGVSADADVVTFGLRSQLPIFVVDFIIGGIGALAEGGDIEPPLFSGANGGNANLVNPAHVGLMEGDVRIVPMRYGSQALDVGVDMRFRWLFAKYETGVDDERIGGLAFSPRLTGGYSVKRDAMYFQSFASFGNMFAADSQLNPELGVGGAIRLRISGPVAWYIRSEMALIYLDLVRTDINTDETLFEVRDWVVLTDFASGLAIDF